MGVPLGAIRACKLGPDGPAMGANRLKHSRMLLNLKGKLPAWPMVI
jgi:hypothetical protein